MNKFFGVTVFILIFLASSAFATEVEKIEKQGAYKVGIEKLTKEDQQKVLAAREFKKKLKLLSIAQKANINTSVTANNITMSLHDWDKYVHALANLDAACDMCLGDLQ